VTGQLLLEEATEVSWVVEAEAGRHRRDIEFGMSQQALGIQHQAVLDALGGGQVFGGLGRFRKPAFNDMQLRGEAPALTRVIGLFSSRFESAASARYLARRFLEYPLS
jgi:hypothetical protein